jgi:hypothetical protein
MGELYITLFCHPIHPTLSHQPQPSCGGQRVWLQTSPAASFYTGHPSYDCQLALLAPTVLLLLLLSLRLFLQLFALLLLVVCLLLYLLPVLAGWPQRLHQC